jgi:hypothetical protein
VDLLLQEAMLLLGVLEEFYRDLKGRMARYGRPPEALKVIPGLNAIVGRSRAICARRE